MANGNASAATGSSASAGVSCAWNGIVVPGPVRIADTTHFTIEVDARSAQDFLWMSSYGLFFNRSEDLRQMYIVRLFQGLQPPEYAVYRWQNFEGSSDDRPPPILLSSTGADWMRSSRMIAILRPMLSPEVFSNTSAPLRGLSDQLVVIRRTGPSRSASETRPFAWKTAVGPAIDRATAISLLDSGALEVRVTDQHWRRELKRSAPMILERLATMLGAGTVTKIEVVHGANDRA